MGFDLDFDQRRALGYQLIDLLNDYYASLPTRAVQPPPVGSPPDAAPRPLPERGGDPALIMKDLAVALIDQGFHTPSANYFGLQNPTPTYMSVLAEALAAALNPQLASLVHSRAAADIERETVHWIGARVGWPGAFDGTFTSGGSEANFTALALALATHFPDCVEQGVAALDARPVLYTSAEAHHSVDKATSLLGLGRQALRRIPVTPAIQMDAALLEARILADRAQGFTPFCIIATAGTTSSGAVDDIAGLADVARRFGLWFHVDGAYGGALVLSDRHRDLIKGIEHADSITMDPHKWLATSMSAGMVLTSHPDALRKVFATINPFMPKARDYQRIDNFDLGLQWSRRMNSLKLWLTLRTHGREAYEELIDRQISLARRFAQWLEGSGAFELAAPQMLPGVIYRVRLPGASEDAVRAANEAVVARVNAGGERWISTAIVNGRSVIRTLVISYLSQTRHLEDLQSALLEATAEIGNGAVRDKVSLSAESPAAMIT